MSSRLALLGLVLLLLAIAVVLSVMQPGPSPIGRQCAGWYGYDPQTGRCDLGMPTLTP